MVTFILEALGKNYFLAFFRFQRTSEILSLQLLLLFQSLPLRFSACCVSSDSLSQLFKDPCDYTGPTQIIQDILLISRPITQPHVQTLLPGNIIYSQVPGVRMLTSLRNHCFVYHTHLKTLDSSNWGKPLTTIIKQPGSLDFPEVAYN